ncbi:MAG: YIP1 family protein [Acidobacteria bacterium]|nr:YIP1 family protein [Acidobacteriota bacterium]MBE3096417.1 YIP1 family protein [Planctomycetota bacterium]
MNLQKRIINILTKPKEEWPVIATEQTSVAALYSGYIAPLAAIPPVCSFIGMSVFGAAIPLFGSLGFGPAYWLTTSIVSYVLGLVGVYVGAFVIQKLAPTFQSEPNLIQALKLVAYASTATWVAGIFSLIPPLAILGILAALYGIYLFYLGVTPLMKTPQDKVIPYMVVAAIVIIVVYVVISVVTGAITGLFFVRPRLGL